jgi:hypothetical protein
MVVHSFFEYRLNIPEDPRFSTTRKIKNAEENAIKRSCNFINVKISV